MLLTKLVFAFLFSGCFGFSAITAFRNGNFEITALAIGMFFATFYIAFWIVDCGR